MYNQKHPFKIFQETMSKDKIPSVVLLCGKEQLMVDWAKNEIVKRYINPTSKIMDYSVIDETDSNIDSVAKAIIDIAETPPMLSEKRIVIVRNTKLLNSGEKGEAKNSDLALLSAYLENVPEFTILVFMGTEVDRRLKLPKALIKYGQVFDFYQLDRDDLIKFFVKRFNDANIGVSRDYMNYIIDRTGYYNKESDYDLYTFSNDIVKIIALVEGDRLTKEIIDEAIEGDKETFIFSLMDSVVKNDKGKALKMIKNIVETSSDAIRIAARLVDHFEILYQIKEFELAGAPDRVILEKMGIKDARLKVMKKFTGGFTLEKLKKILLSTYDIEKNIKMGILNYEGALEVYVSKL